MSAPNSPLEKKDAEEVQLTIEERVNRLEVALENGYNILAKELTSVEDRNTRDLNEFKNSLGSALEILNMAVLENIMTVRVVTKYLGEKEVVDLEAIDKEIKGEIEKTVELRKQLFNEATERLNKEGKKAKETETNTL